MNRCAAAGSFRQSRALSRRRCRAAPPNDPGINRKTLPNTNLSIEAPIAGKREVTSLSIIGTLNCQRDEAEE
jgi:hypothetical protein